MTSVTVVTCFPVDAWELYAKRMLETACQFLPLNVSILAYYNSVKPEFDNPRVQFIDNYSIEGGVRDFIARHGNDPKKWGKVPGRKDNFRFNVCAYAHKVAALYDASLHTTSNILVYCDADVVFFAPVTESFFDETIPFPHYICLLDRGASYHAETGFVGVRTHHPFHKEFMERLIDYYRKDSFLQEKEHHDAYLFTQLVRQMQRERKLTFYNLSPGFNGAGHPWLMSRLAEFADHAKGIGRKQIGKSFKEDLRKERIEPYWQNLPSRTNLKAK